MCRVPLSNQDKSSDENHQEMHILYDYIFIVMFYFIAISVLGFFKVQASGIMKPSPNDLRIKCTN
jgi:hypothetical protein